MKVRHLGIAIVVAWLGQLAFLWPLPPQIVEQMIDRTPEVKAVIGDYEQTLWLGWFARLGLVLLGVASGIAAFRDSAKWPAVYLTCAAAYVLVFQPWQWVPLLLSGLWKRPEFFFNTIFFPIFVIGVAVYAAIHIGMTRRRHAV